MFEVFKAIMQRQRLHIDPSVRLWTPSLPLSFSMAITGGSVGIMNTRDTRNIAAPRKNDHEEAMFPAIPRLRLPQKGTKSRSESRSERPALTREYTGSWGKTRSREENPREAMGHTYPANIPDLPTRPVLPPIHTSQPVIDTSYQAPQPYQMLQVGVGWDAGLLRRSEPNEDSILSLQGMCSYKGQIVPFGLFCIADGMGGHADGKEASRIAIERMMQTVLQNILMGHDLSEEFLTDMLVGGVEWANLAIYHHAQSTLKDMGTTLTAALVIDNKAHIVNVGDSRTYIYREGEELLQVTRDHSLVATLVEDGEITVDEIYTHPDRSKIYRSLGCSETVEVDWFVVDLRPQDRLVLCSDGLWEMVRDASIERFLRICREPVDASNRLVQAALRAGGADNISVIIVLNS
jgi:serine/threonine protein phosphatase PrpC